MKKWRVGLVGTGYWSEKHIKAWKRIPNVEFISLCNHSEEKLYKRAQEFGVPNHHLYLNLDEMLDKEELDIVDVVTGPETHLDFVKRISQSGRHIMCQKPFASSVKEATEMVRIANENGIRLMVTENWRWLETYQEVKKILNSGILGKVSVARYYHSDFYTPRMADGVQLPQPFFRKMENLLFYEMGAHWFDTWRFLFDTPKRLFAETIRISPYIIGEDTGTVILGYDDFYGILDMSWASRRLLKQKLSTEVSPNHLEELIVEGDKATLKLYYSGKITIVHNDGEEIMIKNLAPYDHEESHYRLQSHFISCLDSGEEFQTSGADNLMTLKMVFGTYQSSKTHSLIEFN